MRKKPLHESLAHTGILLGQRDTIDCSKLWRYVIFQYELSQDMEVAKAQIRNLQESLADEPHVSLLKRHPITKVSYVYVHLLTEGHTPPSLENLTATQVKPSHDPELSFLLSVYLRLLFREAMRDLGFASTFEDQSVVKNTSVKRTKDFLDLWTLDCRVDSDEDSTKDAFKVSFFINHSAFARFNEKYHAKRTKGILLRERLDPKKRETTFSMSWVYGAMADLELTNRESLFMKRKSGIRTGSLDFLDLTNHKRFRECKTSILHRAMTSFMKKGAQYGVDLTPEVRRFLRLAHPKPAKHETEQTSTVMGIPVDPSLTLHVLDRRSHTQQILHPAEDWVAHVQPLLASSKHLHRVDVRFQYIHECDLEGANALPPDSLLLILLDEGPGGADDPYDRTLPTRYPTQHIIVRPAEEKPVKATSRSKKGSAPNTTPNDEASKTQSFVFELTDKDYERHAQDLLICLKELVIKRAVRRPSTDFRLLFPSLQAFLKGNTFFMSEMDTRGLFFFGTNEKGQGVAYQIAKREVEKAPYYNLVPISENLEKLNQLVGAWHPQNTPLGPLDHIMGKLPPDYREASAKALNRLKGKMVLWHQDDQGKRHVILFNKNRRLFMLPTNVNEVDTSLEQAYAELPKATWRFQENFESAVTALKAHFQDKVDEASIRAHLEAWNAWLDLDDTPPLLHFKKIIQGLRARAKRDSTQQVAWGKIWGEALGTFFDGRHAYTRSILRYPGKEGVWLEQSQDPKARLLYVSSKSAQKPHNAKQGSFHDLLLFQDESDLSWLLPLFAVEWSRLNQYSGNPCLHVLTKQFADYLEPTRLGQAEFESEDED